MTEERRHWTKKEREEFCRAYLDACGIPWRDGDVVALANWVSVHFSHRRPLFPDHVPFKRKGRKP